MAQALHGRDHAQVERVAGVVGEGADAAFAERDVVVAFTQDVFGGHQKFFERGRHAALQQDGLAGASGALEQRKILHVAGADLDHVGVFLDQVERFVVDGLGNDLHAELLADVGHDAQAFFAESLKRVGRSARLVGSAAEKLGSGAMHALGRGEGLFAGLDAAGAGNNRKAGPPMVAAVPGKVMTVLSCLTSRLTSL